MTIKSDRWIRQMAEQHGMIEPFEPQLVRHVPSEITRNMRPVVSYGLSSYGYDIRCAREFKVFTNINSTIVDPKNFDPRNFVEIEADECIIPPNSFALARTVEYFRIPRDVLTVCLGKSTYARCFTGDTRVRLVDGTSPTFVELVDRYESGEDRFFGYGWNGSKYVAQLMTQPRKVGVERIFNVTIDSGEVIRCTGDHEFYLRSGGTKQAKDLSPGDSLLPLYLHDSHGYESIYDPVNRTWQPTHLAVRDMMVRNGEWGSDAMEKEVHHIDFAKRNNHPSNLQSLTEEEHSSIHNATKNLSEQSASYWRNKANKDAHLAILHSPENFAKAGASRSAFYATPKGKAMLSERTKKVWSSSSEKRRENQRAIAAQINLRSDVTRESVISALLAKKTIRGAARALDVDRSAFRRFPDVIQQFKSGALCNSHKVVSVVETDEESDVYCLSAETGNFALNSGVIVSNCGIIVNVTPFEPEWEGYVTLEFSNTTPLPAKIYAGEGCAQVLFFQSDEQCETSYRDRGGKYQGQVGVTLPKV
jgi:dCTP deaminase